MNFTPLIVAGLFTLPVMAAAMAIAWQMQKVSMEKARNQNIAVVAATLAAPHLSPDGNHTEENRTIIRHWLRFTRDLFQDDQLSP